MTKFLRNSVSGGILKNTALDVKRLGLESPPTSINKHGQKHRTLSRSAVMRNYGCNSAYASYFTSLDTMVTNKNHELTRLQEFLFKLLKEHPDYGTAEIDAALRQRSFLKTDDEDDVKEKTKPLSDAVFGLNECKHKPLS